MGNKIKLKIILSRDPKQVARIKDGAADCNDPIGFIPIKESRRGNLERIKGEESGKGPHENTRISIEYTI